jgi:hypothetical protein
VENASQSEKILEGSKVEGPAGKKRRRRGLWLKRWRARNPLLEDPASEEGEGVAGSDAQHCSLPGRCSRPCGCALRKPWTLGQPSEADRVSLWSRALPTAQDPFMVEKRRVSTAVMSRANTACVEQAPPPELSDVYKDMLKERTTTISHVRRRAREAALVKRSVEQKDLLITIINKLNHLQDMRELRARPRKQQHTHR